MDNNNIGSNNDHSNDPYQAGNMPQNSQQMNGTPRGMPQYDGQPMQYVQPPQYNMPQNPLPYNNAPYGNYPPPQDNMQQQTNDENSLYGNYSIPIYNPYVQQEVKKKEGTAGFGVTALVLGILSVVGGMCFYVGGLPFALLGIIFGIVGMIVKGPKSAKGMAAAGLILSVFMLVGGYIIWDMITGGLWDYLKT